MINYIYTATITKIIDGDTVDAIVDLGFSVQTKIRFRLNGIDTPELNQKSSEIKSIASQAKQFLVDQILNKQVTILSTKTDKYGRWLADINLDLDAPSINKQLISLGLAKKYLGDNKTTLWE